MLQDDAQGAIDGDKLNVVEQLRNQHAAELQAAQDEIEQAEEQLSKLRVKYDEVSRKLSSLDDYLSRVRPSNEIEMHDAPAAIATTPATPKAPKPRKDRSGVKERILALLAKAPPEGFVAADIRAKLKLEETSRELSGLMSYLKSRGKVAIDDDYRWTLARKE